MSRGAILRAAPLLLIAAALASAADHSSSLEGTIFNAASGEPLRKTVVTLRPDNQGQPFPGATVVIAPEKGRPLVVTTKPSGGFTAGGLAPGNYRVWAFDEIENGHGTIPNT